MADEITPQGDAAPVEPVETPEPASTDWKAESRKWESRAKDNLAAAKANEGAAKRLAELEEAQKTEAQKTAERLEAAERRASELEVQAIRAEVAAEKGVPLALLSGATKDDLIAAADALLAFKGQAQTDAPVAPGEGSLRDTRGASQLTEADIKQLTPEEVNKARRDGRLNKLLGIT